MHLNLLSNDSGWILRISEWIRSLVFNQMCDDAVFALETPVFCFQFQLGFIAQDALWETRALFDVTLEVCSRGVRYWKKMISRYFGGFFR